VLVEQARTYKDAVEAVFEHAKTLQYVGSLGIEAMPLIGYILVLANRRGLTDQQVRRLSQADVRHLAEQGARTADTIEEEASLRILDWFEESNRFPEDRRHRNMVFQTGINGLLANLA
jgi:hypothetical protein